MIGDVEGKAGNNTKKQTKKKKLTKNENDENSFFHAFPHFDSGNIIPVFRRHCL